MSFLATVQYTTSGTGPYTVPFPFRLNTDLIVTVNNSAVAFTVSGAVVTLAAPPAVGVLTIKRSTSQTARLVVYGDGATLSQEALNTDSVQSFNMSQEAIDAGTIAGTLANTAAATATTALANSVAAVTAANTANTTAAAAVVTANTANTTAAAAVATANTANTTANTANTTANTANTTAASAVATANTANTTANTASTTAITANTAAAAAVVTANTANTTAGAANTNASTALSTANTALSTANTANTTANTANTTANTALSTANAASTAASSAVATANTASTNASTALSTANTANTNSVAAVTAANTANTNASTALSTANTANTTANTALSTANGASTAANNAVSTANAANTTAANAFTAANNALQDIAGVWDGENKRIASVSAGTQAADVVIKSQLDSAVAGINGDTNIMRKLGAGDNQWNAENLKIKNVPAGTVSGDAVNKGQLDSVNATATAAQTASTNNAVAIAQNTSSIVSLQNTALLENLSNQWAGEGKELTNIGLAVDTLSAVRKGQMEAAIAAAVVGSGLPLDSGDNQWDAGTRKLKNLVNGTVSGDAVTYNQLTGVIGTVTTAQVTANSAIVDAAAAQSTANAANSLAGTATASVATALKHGVGPTAAYIADVGREIQQAAAPSLGDSLTNRTYVDTQISAALGAAAGGAKNLLLNGQMKVSQRGPQTIPAGFGLSSSDRFQAFASVNNVPTAFDTSMGTMPTTGKPALVLTVPSVSGELSVARIRQLVPQSHSRPLFNASNGLSYRAQARVYQANGQPIGFGSVNIYVYRMVSVDTSVGAVFHANPVVDTLSATEAVVSGTFTIPTAADFDQGYIVEVAFSWNSPPSTGLSDVYVTDVQLTVGSAVTGVEDVDSSVELMRCLPFYEKTGDHGGSWYGHNVTIAEDYFVTERFVVSKRTLPTTDVTITQSLGNVTPCFTVGSLMGLPSIDDRGFVASIPADITATAGDAAGFVYSWTANAELT